MISSANWKTFVDWMVSEVIASTRMGMSAGFDFLYWGGPGILTGRSLEEALMAAITSRAAESILRERSNCRLMEHPPRELDEVISLTPGICPKRRSNGAARDWATVSGSAPGSFAETEIIGESTRGRAETGNSL